MVHLGPNPKSSLGPPTFIQQLRLHDEKAVHSDDQGAEAIQSSTLIKSNRPKSTQPLLTPLNCKLLLEYINNNKSECFLFYLFYSKNNILPSSSINKEIVLDDLINFSDLSNLELLDLL